MLGLDPVQLHYLPGYAYNDDLDVLINLAKIGIILGLVAVFIPRTKRLWAILGIVLNLLLVPLLNSLYYA